MTVGRDTKVFECVKLILRPSRSQQITVGNCIDVGDDEVVCDLCYSLPGKRTKNLKDGSRGGIDGISCQQLQVLMTELLQKHWSGRKTGGKTCSRASQKKMDIKTAFDVERPCTL